MHGNTCYIQFHWYSALSKKSYFSLWENKQKTPPTKTSKANNHHHHHTHTHAPNTKQMNKKNSLGCKAEFPAPVCANIKVHNEYIWTPVWEETQLEAL